MLLLWSIFITYIALPSRLYRPTSINNQLINHLKLLWYLHYCLFTYIILYTVIDSSTTKKNFSPVSRLVLKAPIGVRGARDDTVSVVDFAALCAHVAVPTVVQYDATAGRTRVVVDGGGTRGEVPAVWCLSPGETSAKRSNGNLQRTVRTQHPTCERKQRRTRSGVCTERSSRVVQVEMGAW